MVAVIVVLVSLVVSALPVASAALVYLPSDPMSPSSVVATLSSDGTTAPPSNEVIDLVTDIVYHYDGATLTPVGVGTAPLGYVNVVAYPGGYVSGEPVHDVACTVTTMASSENCGTCPTVACVTWRVAVVGSHDVKLALTWTGWVYVEVDPIKHTYACEHETLPPPWFGPLPPVDYPASGGAVTIKGDTLAMSPPSLYYTPWWDWYYCPWPGTLAAELTIDETYHYHSQTAWSYAASAYPNEVSDGYQCIYFKGSQPYVWLDYQCDPAGVYSPSLYQVPCTTSVEACTGSNPATCVGAIALADTAGVVNSGAPPPLPPFPLPLPWTFCGVTVFLPPVGEPPTGVNIRYAFFCHLPDTGDVCARAADTVDGLPLPWGGH